MKFVFIFVCYVFVFYINDFIQILFLHDILLILFSKNISHLRYFGWREERIVSRTMLLVDIFIFSSKIEIDFD